MDINIPNEFTDITNIDDIKFKKMIFVYNALENGWTITKKENSYIFKKLHEGKKEIFLDNYLKRFVEENFDINNFINTV
jgi:hypothetical protein|tara:strand:+ start:710 stop:946 length:237 start_codon:yes stop_codon:yes gene_type:complete